MRLLFLSRWFPYPPSNGSKLRIYNLLRGLAQHHEITLLSFADQMVVARDAPELRSLCSEVQVIPWKPFNPHSRRATLGFLSLTPRSVVDTFSPEMQERIDQVLLEGEYDVIIASEIDMAIYSRFFRGIPALLDELQVGVLYEQFARASSFRHRFRYGLTWVKLRRYLSSILRNFEACVVASDRERQLLSEAVTDYQPVEVIPNCVSVLDYSDIHEEPKPNSLIFTGSFSFSPNYEAMVWFLQEVHPRILAQVPNVRLTITGDHANRPLPPASNVTLTGFVDDVRPLIAQSWTSVVPLHSGGGTRLKILEAMALGTPVVATSKGAEGLDLHDSEHILIADTPEVFAQRVIQLLKEPKLRQQLVTNSRQLVREKYDWAVVMPRFLALVEQAALA